MEDGTIVGVGTGSTVAFFIEALAERRIADTVLVLQERAKVAAAQVAKTDTVYRERVKQLAGATIVTEHHDTVYLDTVRQVQNVTLACTQTIAARDTAMTLCEQRLAALRSLFVTDTVRRAAEIVHLGQEVSRQRRAGRRQGWLQGATVGAAAMVLVRYVLK